MKVHIEKIKREIDRLGWSIPILAEKVGIPRQTLYLIFQNETAQIGTLNKIAQALDLDGKDLLI